MEGNSDTFLKLLLSACVALLSINSGMAQTIKGKLIFNSSSSISSSAKGMKVVLMPRTTANEKIATNNFFYGDDQQQLDKMKAIVTYTNEAGNYFFSNVPAGRYILKVCWAYGMVYKFRIVNSHYKVLLIKDLPAVYTK